MKISKKLLGLLVTACMAIAMCIPVMAASTTTITAPNNSRTYEIYQIFTGDLSNGVLSNVKWGRNGTQTEGTAVSSTVLAELEAISSTAADTTKLATIEKYVDMTKDSMGTVTDGSSINVPTGYYLIKDNGAVDDGESYSLYVVQVVGPTEISPKSGTTSSEKKVKDVNDSVADSTTDWQDSADYDIGDEVPFKLTATIASDYANYKKFYKLTFHDTESAGLTFNKDSVVVKVDGETITTDYTVIEDPTDNCTFEVKFTNLKNIASVKAGSKITVEYTSTLNTSANVGTTGNPNESWITYSNNPNSNQTGETGGDEGGKTPHDKVIVFTYKTVVNKTDENNQPLAGAEFTLEKYDAEKQEWVAKKVVKNEAKTTFTFSGLDDGRYRITETETPAGYNSIDPIYFVIEATHSEEADDPTLTNLTATQTDANGTKLTGNDVTATFTATMTANSASVATNIVNESGSTLPSTGGMGTTIFYVVGTVLVLGAAILLITKKRMSAEE